MLPVDGGMRMTERSAANALGRREKKQAPVATSMRTHRRAKRHSEFQHYRSNVKYFARNN